MIIGRLLSNYKLYLLWGAAVIMLAALLALPAETSAAVTKSAALCVNLLLPSLFPFFVLSAVVVETGLASAAGRYFEFLMRPLFGVPGACAPAFILGILCGYPVGAKTAISLYQKGLCSKYEAERLLAFCNNSGPAFILGSVGIGIWHDPKIGILLYFCHAVASLLTGFLFRFYKKGQKGGCLRKKATENHCGGIQKSITNAIRDSSLNMLYLCGFVIFFAVLTALLFNLRVIPTLAACLTKIFCFTGLSGEFFQNLLAGILELTSGVDGIGKASGAALPRIALTGAMLGWAGLSIHAQVAAFLSGSGLSAKPYILGKLIQSLIAGGLTYIAVALFPYKIASLPAFAMNIGGENPFTFLNMLRTSGGVFVLCTLTFLTLLTIGIVISQKTRAARRGQRAARRD